MPKHSTRHCAVLASAFCLLPLVFGCATGDDTPDSPDLAARQFAQLDLEGARLSPDTYGKIDPFVEWEGRPHWETVYLVSGFDIADTQVTGDTAEVRVAYRMLNRVNMAAFGPTDPNDPQLLDDLQRNSGIVLKMNHTRDGWKIAEPMFQPRVSPMALHNYIKEHMQWEKDTRLQSMMAYLADLSAQP